MTKGDNMKVNFLRDSIYLELEDTPGLIGVEDRKEICFIEDTLGLLTGTACKVCRHEDEFGTVLGLTIRTIKEQGR